MKDNQREGAPPPPVPPQQGVVPPPPAQRATAEADLPDLLALNEARQAKQPPGAPPATPATAAEADLPDLLALNEARPAQQQPPATPAQDSAIDEEFLFGDMEPEAPPSEDEAPPAEMSSAGEIRSRTRELGLWVKPLAELLRAEQKDERDITNTAGKASTLLEEARGFIDALAVDEDQEAQEARTELVETYFHLRRLVERAHEVLGSTAAEMALPRAARPKAKAKAKADKTPSARPSASPEARRRRRIVMLAVVLGLAVVARLAMLLTADDTGPAEPPTLEAARTSEAVVTANNDPQATQQLREGLPVVDSVLLTHVPDGLVAMITASSASKTPPSYAVTWKEDGHPVEQQDVSPIGKTFTARAMLKKALLKKGSSYQAEVVPRIGTLKGKPLTSAKLGYKGSAN